MNYRQAIDDAMQEMVRKIIMEHSDEIEAMARRHPDKEYDYFISILARRIIQTEPA